MLKYGPNVPLPTLGIENLELGPYFNNLTFD
jgi:hypothetical protein